MNTTLDDTAPALIYSSGWGVQPVTGAQNVSSFYQSTYHVALADGASVNLTVPGASVVMFSHYAWLSPTPSRQGLPCMCTA